MAWVWTMVRAAGAAVLAVTCALSPRASAGGATARPVTVDTAAIDRYVEREMRAARIPGVAIGIVQGDEILYTRGYGVADAEGRAVTPQTPFYLGSVTKSFTALAIMQLVEAGKVDLDAPAQRYLSWFQLADPTAARQITVRQLLNHTSGIPTYAGELAFIERSRRSIEALLRAQAGVRPVSRPGEEFHYSNLNYIVLGAIVETASGQSYAEYVAQHIFGPLEMPNSYAASEQAAGVSTGYQYFFGFPRPIASPNSPGTVPAGRLISSAEDMCHYLAMWFNDGRYDGSTLVTSTGAQQLRQPAAQVTSYVRYAMGWYTNPEASVVWHGGSTENFRASMKIITKDGLAVVALYNITDDTLQALFGEGYLIADGIISILYGEEPPVSSIVNTGQIYYVLDGVAVLLVAAVLFDALRLRRWAGQLRANRAKALAALAGMLVFDFLCPLAVLLGVPRAVAWPVVLANVPDYGYLLVGLSLVLLIMGVAKLGAGLFLLRRARTPTDSLLPR